jgi:hypothetical protein
MASAARIAEELGADRRGTAPTIQEAAVAVEPAELIAEDSESADEADGDE